MALNAKEQVSSSTTDRLNTTTTSGMSQASSVSTAADKPETVSTAAYVSDKTDDSSRLKTLLSILRKFIGVSDIAAVRFSLPAQLLEPTPNLEYWNYLDRPETFVAIGEAQDGLGRMLEVLRFWFTKDLKFIKAKPCKPYNSALGEFFRCNWDVKDSALPVLGESIAASSSSSSSTKGSESIQQHSQSQQVPIASQQDPHEPIRVSYLTEQTSHHPPVSAFWIECPAKGLSAYGFDQLSAKFTGTSIRVTPGVYNLGIFIRLHRHEDEEYQLTHPVASLGGLLRGAFSVSVADTCFITCVRTRIRVILQYLEESWLGKTQNRVHGVIFSYDPNDKATHHTRIKDVAERNVLARLEGSWHEVITYTLVGKDVDSKSRPLIDLRALHPLPKQIPPIDNQLPNESQRFWHGVTSGIRERRFAEATRLKQDLEEEQRVKVRAREKAGHVWRPRFFQQATTDNGRPVLSEQGQAALRGLSQGQYQLDQSEA